MDGESSLIHASFAQQTISLQPGQSIISIIRGSALEIAAGQGRIEVLPIVQTETPTPLKTDQYQTALSLLKCAGEALEILYGKRDHLEALLEDVSIRAEDAAIAAQAKVADWQMLAASLKKHAQELEQRLAEMQQRTERAETQLKVERVRADAAERRAADALGLSHGLYSKIISTFGQGSAVHTALLVTVDEDAAHNGGCAFDV